MISPRLTGSPWTAARVRRLVGLVGGRGTSFEPAGEAAALAAFRRRYPAYGATAHLDELRRTEYARLDTQGQTYLDYTGGGLYAESQVRAHETLLRDQVLGNPHSINPTSAASTELAEGARAAVLRWFNASPDEYCVIFTPNATGALRLVAEAYPFGPGGRCLLTADNHNSVNGVREYARAAGASTTYVSSTTPSLRVDEPALDLELRRAEHGRDNLFAYPAQSNFSGVQHSLEWVARARALGWDVLVDAAAFVPTNRLDLSVWKPDFVPVSFYKLLGYPTGVGCLLVRRSALAKLRRPWFAGGTIVAVSVQGDWHVLAGGEAAFEDGTVNYLALPAVAQGLAYLESVGIDAVHERVLCLTGWVLRELLALRHANGRPVAQVYGPETTERRGGTIAFNFLRPDGSLVDERVVDRAAAAAGISLRTGCFCNPGVAEHAFALDPERLRVDPQYETYGDYVAGVGMPTGGAVRASLGLATTFADVYRFMRFATVFRDRPADTEPLPPRLSC
jgi:selenocysteine lyase/cysteine desulfurase